MPLRPIGTIVLVLGLLAGAARAEDSGRITGVVLYPGSATVERSAPVAPGSGRLQMTGLPANFDVRTLRVEADDGIRIGEVAVQDESRADALGEREAALEARIQALKDERAALEAEAKTAELVRDYLAALSRRPALEGGTSAAIDPKAIPAVLEAIRRGAADAYGALQRVEIRKRGADKTLAALERDLARLKSGARDARTLAIGYSASRAGELRASYQVANAGWKPAYRAALDSSASRVALERQAIVMQRTGEDWRGVRLRLSTGQPRAAAIIDPAPWELVIKPQTPSAPLARTAASDKEAVADERRPAVPAVAQVETRYATEFEVPGSVELPADGSRITVSLSTSLVDVKQRVRVVPRRDLSAMVTAEAPLPDGVWIAGEVQLYRDGAYIGSTFWQPQAKERLALPFGRDDRIQVAVSRTLDRSGSGGFVGQRAQRQIADLYAITSRYKRPVQLVVLEASPVAVADSISVDALFEPKPKLRDWEDRRGVVAWEQPLAPGETLKFAADYTITYPKDAAVIGLP
jgi:uncharacterized protein (TIGR02231 family)